MADENQGFKGFRGFKKWGRKKRKLEKEKEIRKAELKEKARRAYTDIDSGQVFLLSAEENPDSNNTINSNETEAENLNNDFQKSSTLQKSDENNSFKDIQFEDMSFRQDNLKNNNEKFFEDTSFQQNINYENTNEDFLQEQNTNLQDTVADFVNENHDISSNGDGNSSTNIDNDRDISSKGDDAQAEAPKSAEFFKPKKYKYFFRVVWIVFLAFISILVASYGLTAMNDMLGLGEANNAIVVDIPKNAGIDTVARILKDKGVIKQEFFFKVYAFVTKNHKGFLSGTFELKANMDYQVILNNIKSQTVNKDVVNVSFREGMNILEYADLLDENGVCNKDAFLEKCNSDEFDDKYDFLKEIKNKGDRHYKLEGYLFPDTYEFYKGENPSSAIRRFLSNFQKKVIKQNMHDGYEKKTSIKHLSEEAGKTLDEILNIASMIQAEAANKNDMYAVSSVIYNRLSTLPSDGINKFGEFGLANLGIDSTVWYPYKTKNVVPENIVDTFESTYDTYEITGLPPGPICNPGMEALYAALKPENTEYYYFCHSKEGDSYYAKTNDVHLSNLKKAGLV